MIRLVTGDECGLVKLVDATKRLLLSTLGSGDEQTRKREIVQTVWLPSSQAEEDDENVPLSTSRVATLTRAGIVEIWDTSAGAGTLGKRLHRCSGAGEDGILLATRRGRFVTVSKDGFVRIFSHSSVNANDTTAPVSQWSSSSLEYWSPPCTFRVAENVVCAKLHRDGTHLAIGGKEVELSVWDINQGKQIWQAKNVENDFLDMRVPVWIRSLTFLRDFDSTVVSSSHSYLIAIASAYKHLRIYDTRSSDARPIKSIEIGDYGFTSLALSGDGRSLITGDASGFLRRMDASSLELTGTLHGPAGSIRSIDSHPTLPYVASVSLDRCLWIHNIHTRQLVRRIYLKQRLNSVMFERPGGFSIPPPPVEGFNSKGGKYYISQMQLKASHEASTSRQGADSGGLVPDFAPAGAGRKAKLIKMIENSKRLVTESAAGHGKETKDILTEADEDWKELDRRAAAATTTAAQDDDDEDYDENEDGIVDDAEDISDMSDIEEDGEKDGEGPSLSSKKRKSRDDDEEEEDEEEEEEENDDDVDDDEEEEEEEGEVDDKDFEKDDDDDDDNDDDDDDDDKDDDDDDNTSSLVDSRSVARSLLKQTEDVKFAESRRKGVGKGGSKLSVKASARAIVASRLKRKQRDKKRK
jgi:hypothetical protein